VRCNAEKIGCTRFVCILPERTPLDDLSLRNTNNSFAGHRVITPHRSRGRSTPGAIPVDKLKLERFEGLGSIIRVPGRSFALVAFRLLRGKAEFY
jgi:hypothetical protein